MNPITHFSRHSLQRLGERSSLTPLELARILDSGEFVGTGREPGFNREHRLFYSERDQNHYVVIQDIHTGRVVTILTIEYHENIAWRIHERDLESAKNLALYSTKKCEIGYTNGSLNNKPPSTFVVSAHYNDTNGDQKTKDFLKVKAGDYNMDISQLLNDSLLNSSILNALKIKSILPETVWSVSIRHGQKGAKLYFDWKNNAIV